MQVFMDRVAGLFSPVPLFALRPRGPTKHLQLN